MIRARLTRRQYMETIAEHEQAQRSKRGSSKLKTGFRPHRRPLDAFGNKLRGAAYKQWLEEALSSKDD